MCDCLGNTGFTMGEEIRAAAIATAATMRQAAAIAQIGISANDMADIYGKKKDMAQRQQTIANETQAHMESVFWPKELQFLAEFDSLEAEETAEALGTRYAGRLVSTVAGKFADKIHEFKCNAPRYCTSSVSKGLQDLMLARGQAIANARVMGRLIGYAEVQSRDELNYKRRQQAISIGRGLVSQAAKLYGDAASTMASIGQDVASQLNAGIGALGRASNYYVPPSAEMQRMAAQRSYQGFNSDSTFGLAANNAQLNTRVESIDGTRLDPGLRLDTNFTVSQEDPTIIGAKGIERSMNEGDVGNRDRARVGSHTYYGNTYEGDGFELKIDMKDFKLEFVDHVQPGETG